VAKTPKKTTKRKTAKKAVKKAPKKPVKEAAKTTSKKPGSAPNAKLTAKDLAHFQDLLLQKRREIIGSVNEIHDEALKNSRMDASGDLSSMPIHMADLGSDTYEQEFALDLMDSERKLLHEIDDALRRIAENTYGLCEATGKPIKKARLEAQPWARYCVEFARRLEQGLVREPQE
jgi:DnaK suppressor protein